MLLVHDVRSSRGLRECRERGLLVTRVERARMRGKRRVVGCMMSWLVGASVCLLERVVDGELWCNALG